MFRRIILALLMACAAARGEEPTSRRIPPPATLPTNILAAADTGEIHWVQHFISAGQDINSTNVEGLTPLCFAVRRQSEDLVRWMLDNGAKADIRTRAGESPLHVAAALGNVAIVRMLIEHGVDVD